MKHLRRYIRNALLEAFNTPNPGNIHDRLAFIRIEHENGNGGYVYAILDPQMVEHALSNLKHQHHGDANAAVLNDSLVGMMRIDEMTFGCNDAYVVDSVAADHGLGPTVYDIVSMDPKLIGGIIADRRTVRPKSRRVWHYYYSNRREDLEGLEPLDDVDSPVTDSDNDDCSLSAYHEQMTPLLPMFLFASLVWLQEKYPKYYGFVEDAFSIGRLGPRGISYEMAEQYQHELIERSIARSFISQVDGALMEGDDLPAELESQYNEFAIRIQDEPDMLYKYIDDDPRMPMNFSYKVKIQPEWYQMQARGEKIKNQLLDKFDTLTEDYFDNQILWRTRDFFRERYSGNISI